MKTWMTAVGMALGLLQLSAPKLGLSVKYLRGFGARARFQGSVFTFSFTVPIEQAIQAIAAAAA